MEAQMTADHATHPRESAEDIWQQLDKLKSQAQQRKKANEARIQSGANNIRSSEPAYRNQTRPSTNQQVSSPPAGYAGRITSTKRQGGVDPILFDSLGNLTSKKFSNQQPTDTTPKPPPISGPCVNGEWTVLHLEASRNPDMIPALIASGASLDAQDSRGCTLLHAVHARKDAKAANQLLAAGANPLVANAQGLAPLCHALADWPELAQPMADVIPVGAKENANILGFTEIHMAVWSPAVLYTLLSKGMRDNENFVGETALYLASSDGQQLSVKYLLGNRPAGESASEFLKYLDSRSKETGRTALGEACLKNNDEIAELLLRHGARIDHSQNKSSLLKVAVGKSNTRMVQLLLDHGAAEFESDIVDLLFKAAKGGQSEAVSMLGRHVSLSRDQQFKLLAKWGRSRDCATLAAISPLISLPVTNVKVLMESDSFLKIPFKEDSPELLIAMLEFFEQRDSFHYVIQFFISRLMDDHSSEKHADFGKALLHFALPRFSRLSSDRETVMRLLQLSEQLKDYSLITEIKEKNFSGKWFADKKIPFKPAWISDPVSRELLDLKEAQDSSRFSTMLQTMTSLMSNSSHTYPPDGAQLSNDLIFALKSDSVGNALDEVFDTHRISALARQALKPVLQGLITQLHPDPAMRTDAICRYLIAYALSSLEDNPRFKQHPAFELMQSNPQWASMQQKVTAEIEVFEEVGTTILDTMASVQLWRTLPDKAAQLALQSLKESDAASYLTHAFQSLGALDVPSRRLAQASASAARHWRDQGGVVPSSGNLPQSEQLQLKTLIASQLSALRRLPSLPENMTSTVLNVESDLNTEFHAMLWWQWDLIHQAFGVDTTENIINMSDSEGLSGDSSEEAESEKS